MNSKKNVSKAFKGHAGVNRAQLVHFQATQLKFGFIEIEEKQKRFKAMAPKSLEEYLRKSPVLVVLGPPGIKDTRPYPSIVEVAGKIEAWSKNRNKDVETANDVSAEKTGETKLADDAAATIFVIDRHHQSLALLLNGFKTAPIQVVHDFSDLTTEQFWQTMKDKHLLYPNADNGEPASFDDIYRSLAWYVRKAGGFDKVAVPYAEFHWADYFRERMDKEFVTGNFEAAIKEAMTLAQSADASELPGYIVTKQQSSFKTSNKKSYKNPKGL